METKINSNRNMWFWCWFIETVLMFAYKSALEFFFIPVYYKVFGYMSAQLQINTEKWIVSNVLLVVFMLLIINRKKIEQVMYLYLIRFLYLFCVVPALSVYAFRVEVGFWAFAFPTVYFVIIVLFMKYYSYKEVSREKEKLKLPKLLHVDMFVPLVCAVMAVGIWAMAGFPVIMDMSETTSQRMALRANKLPSIVNYLFMFLGGTIFPFFVARYIDKKKYILAFVSFACGLLMFFVNGMKTWLIFYLLIIAIYVVYKFVKGSCYKFFFVFEALMVALVLISVIHYRMTKQVSYIAMVARITLIPPGIGFKSIDFFSRNELLFLRESILRTFFDSPYPGGSDFYINYGANSTLTSSRANNGLWGDAFRNFGYFSLVIYPWAFSKILNIVVSNSRLENEKFCIFLSLFMIWQAVNTSFFTWLLTGGVIITIMLLKIYKANIAYENINPGEQDDRIENKEVL